MHQAWLLKVLHEAPNKSLHRVCSAWYSNLEVPHERLHFRVAGSHEVRERGDFPLPSVCEMTGKVVRLFSVVVPQDHNVWPIAGWIHRVQIAALGICACISLLCFFMQVISLPGPGPHMCGAAHMVHRQTMVCLFLSCRSDHCLRQ